jgi:hypothetical protein
MGVEALFGLSVLLSLVAYLVVGKIYVWLRLLLMRRQDAFTALLVPTRFGSLVSVSSFPVWSPVPTGRFHDPRHLWRPRR